MPVVLLGSKYLQNYTLRHQNGFISLLCHLLSIQI